MEGPEREMAAIFTRRKERGLSFPDQDIERIRTLLTKMKKNSWSARPRTYAVLRLLGQETELMDNFVQEDLLDIGLPYNNLTLPLFVKGPTLRRNFINSQPFVLTNAEEMERGSHAHLGKNM
jgi:hypothetical protein